MHSHKYSSEIGVFCSVVTITFPQKSPTRRPVMVADGEIVPTGARFGVSDGENVPSRTRSRVSDAENVPTRSRNTVSDAENVPARARFRVSDGQQPYSAASSGFSAFGALTPSRTLRRN